MTEPPYPPGATADEAYALGYARGRAEELELAADLLTEKPPLIRIYSNSRRSFAAGLRERARGIRQGMTSG